MRMPIVRGSSTVKIEECKSKRKELNKAVEVE